jgi:glycosyltransferase involved in cell wall biosynthesis
MTVSVIIPVYNGAAYLAEAITSALQQTYAPYEVIVVDDGSTDGSAAVAEAFVPRVRVIRQANAGCGAARNTGVRNASGSLLAFLDADDLWTPEKLAWQVAALDETPAPELVFGRVAIFDSATPTETREVYEGIIAGAMLVTRAAFDRVGGFTIERGVGEFIDWYARVQECGLPVRLLPQVVMRRRLHAENMTRSADTRAAYLTVLRAALQRRQVSVPPEDDPA